MKWYTCLNEEALDRYADHFAIAMRSAYETTTLEPHIIFDGDRMLLQSYVDRYGLTVHRRQTPLLPDILKVPEGDGYKHRIAAGAFLRLEILEIEQTDSVVLYTDCDVLFERSPDGALSEVRLLAAAPEFETTDWSYFNSGVMLIHVDHCRAEYQALLQLAREKLGIPHFYDQGVYNLHFAGRWEHLPVEMNWKPYWGRSDTSCIVHFHGMKLPGLRAVFGDAPGAVVHDIWRHLYQRDEAAYRFYYHKALSYLERS